MRLSLGLYSFLPSHVRSSLSFGQSRSRFQSVRPPKDRLSRFSESWPDAQQRGRGSTKSVSLYLLSSSLCRLSSRSWRPLGKYRTCRAGLSAEARSVCSREMRNADGTAFLAETQRSVEVPTRRGRGGLETPPLLTLLLTG